MKTARKAILLVLCAILLVVSAVMGTLAYLTDTEDVTNTFTVGKVEIKLDESDESTPDTTDRTEDGNQYHLIPGQTYTKDPTVTLLKDSESSYVFMTVTVKNLKSLTDALTADKYYNNNIFLLQNLCDWQANSPWKFAGFKSVTPAGATEATDGEYRFYYESAQAGAENGNKLPALFNTITVPGDDITSDNIDNLKNVKIVVKAVAIQEAGFDTANDAWKAQFNEEYIIAPVAP